MKHKIIGLDSLFKYSFIQFWRNVQHYLVLSLLVWLPVILLVAATYFSLKPKWDVMMENEGSFYFEDVLEGEPTSDADKAVLRFVELMVVESDDMAVVESEASPGEPITVPASFKIWMVLALILVAVIFILYQMYYHLVLTRLTSLIDHGSKISYGDVIRWSFGKLGGFFMLSVRIFFYTYSWLLVLSLLLFTVSPFVLSQFDGGIERFGYISIFLGFVAFASVVLVIIRAPRTSVSNYVYVDEGVSSKEALAGSIKLTQGNWWRVIGYILALIVFAAILDTLVTAIGGETGSFLLSILVTYFSVIYFFGFYRLLQARQGK